MNNFLLVVGALLVGILTALVAVPMLIDWNSYRGVFEEEASRLLGRDVRVGGGVNLRILPVPFVRFEKLRIADTTSTGGDPLFRAESVTMQLSVAPLLKGVLEAKSIELKRPLLRLAVDADGRANWRSLTLQAGSLPFVPADVALQSVGIEDGKLVLAGSGTRDITEIDGIAGELSADGFEGPYRFKGSARWGGAAREIKASTARPEADGSIRVRTSVRAPATDTTTTFDGRLFDLKGHPRFEGALAANVRMSVAAPGPKPVEGDDPTAMDFKANVVGDLKGGELKEIELSRDDAADPQLVTGSAKASWDSAVKVDLALSAKSFNLDRLGGAAPDGKSAADPVQTARTALAVALGVLPAEAETDATFTAERATLNGEPLSGLTLTVARRDGGLEIRSFKAVLPGATRLLASGSLTKDPRQPSFAGPISLRGTNLARFVAWARKASAADAAVLSRYDGPFALEGQLAMTGSLLELTRASAELSGRIISGEMRYSSEGRRRLGIVLDGERIEASQLWPGGFDPVALKAYLSGSAPGAGAPQPATTGFFGFDPASTDLNLTVRTGHLQLTPAWSLHAVDTDLAVTGGRLEIARLRFDTDEGLGVDADGALAGLTPDPGKAAAASELRGTIRWNLDAATPQAVAALVSAIDWPAANRPPAETVQALAALGPLHLAGSTALGERAPHALDIAVDGMVGTGNVSGRARLDSGLQGWASAPLDLNAAVETGDPARWLALFGLNPSGAVSPAARPARLVLNASGAPRTGLTSFAELRADQNVVSANGRASISEAGDISFDGTSAVAVRDVTDALALAGIALGQGPSDLPFTGTVQVARTPSALVLKTSGATLAGAPFTAAVTLEPDAARPGARVVKADATFEQLTVSGLLMAISERRLEQGPALSIAAGRWPEQPLRLPSMLTGRIDVKANRLVLDGAAAATNLAATVHLEPNIVTIDGFTATMLGGKLQGSLALKPAAAALALDGSLSLTNADLAGLTSSASAPFSASVRLQGQGLSAAGIVASLAGSGEARLGAGRIKGVAPAAVAGVVEAALAGKDPILGDALSETLRQSLAASSLALKPVQVPFAVAYGVARAEPVALSAPEGRSTLDATVDLNALKFTVDWRIAAASKPSPAGTLKPQLSALQFSATGPLSGLPGAETKLSLGSFEQELVVRKMEQDAEELERLRKADEERRRVEEAERVKREEADRLKREEAERVKREEAERQKPAQSASPAATSETGAHPGAGISDAAPASATPAPAPSPEAPPQAVAPVAPAPVPAIRRRTPAPPQASGIPQPFSNNY